MAKDERMRPAFLYAGCMDPEVDALYRDDFQA